MNQLKRCIFPSPHGWVGIAGSARGLARLTPETHSGGNSGILGPPTVGPRPTRRTLFLPRPGSVWNATLPGKWTPWPSWNWI